MSQDLRNNPNIKLGNVELEAGDINDRKNHKIRITAWIDGDIYDELCKRANALTDNRKGRYQTFMNETLRKALFGEPLPNEGDIVSRFVKAVVKGDTK